MSSGFNKHVDRKIKIASSNNYARNHFVSVEKNVKISVQPNYLIKKFVHVKIVYSALNYALITRIITPVMNYFKIITKATAHFLSNKPV